MDVLGLWTVERQWMAKSTAARCRIGESAAPASTQTRIGRSCLSAANPISPAMMKPNERMMSRIPVHVIVSSAALAGAAIHALESLRNGA
jgi:hypothetical protein